MDEVSVTFCLLDRSINVPFYLIRGLASDMHESVGRRK
jgi:hypothetical protein